MKCNFFQIKFKDTNNSKRINKILDLFKLSIGNNIINLKYKKNKKRSLNKNSKIIYYKEYIKKKFGIIIYEKTENNKKIKIFSENFKSNYKERTTLIINNKLKSNKHKYYDEENIEIEEKEYIESDDESYEKEEERNKLKNPIIYKNNKNNYNRTQNQSYNNKNIKKKK